VTGRVHSTEERKALEDALRSWYYWSNPALGTSLPTFHEDAKTYYTGLPGEILWSQDGGKSHELDYTFDFYVVDFVYIEAPPLLEGFPLYVNADYVVNYKSGFYGLHPFPDIANGLYYVRVKYHDTTFDPSVGFWGVFSGQGVSEGEDRWEYGSFYLENVPTEKRIFEPVEVRVEGRFGRSTYPYGEFDFGLIINGTSVLSGEHGVANLNNDYGISGTKNPKTGLQWTIEELDRVFVQFHIGHTASFGTEVCDSINLRVWTRDPATDYEVLGTMPIHRHWTTTMSNQTLINLARPAKLAGYVVYVLYYSAGSYSGLARVGTFYRVSGNNYSSRDWVDFPTGGAAGFYWFPVHLKVEVGDFIGIWFSTGGGLVSEEAYYSPERAVIAAGQKLPCVNEAFSVIGGTDSIVSLCGYIEESVPS
jgi:hypothetical protein